MNNADIGTPPQVSRAGRDLPGLSGRPQSRRLRQVVAAREGIPSRQDAVFRRLLAVADIAAAVSGLVILGGLTGRGVAPASLALLPAIVLIAKVAGRYDHDEVVCRKSTLDETPALLTLAAACAVIWSLIAAVAELPASRASVVILWAAMSVSLLVTRAAARAGARRLAPPDRILIIGDRAARARLVQILQTDHLARAEVVGSLSPAGENKDLERVVRELKVHRVFVMSAGESEATGELIARTNALGVKVSLLPSVLEVVGSAVEFDEVGGLTVLSVRRPGLGRSSQAVKRTTDIAGALIGLTLFAPVGALIALAIKLDSPGTVFYRQPRVGRAGKAFRMIKFRSMIDGAHAQRHALEERNESTGIFKLTGDPRVTRVGRWLRRCSLDEVPQLINVLRGEMSLVGPRPLILDEDRLVEGRHRNRLQLAPGMTGPWQVLGPARPPLSEMVKIDFLYAANWSLWSDLKILVRTLSHVVGLRGV